MRQQYESINNEWDVHFNEGLKHNFIKGIKDGTIEEPMKWMFQSVPDEIINFVDVIRECYIENLEDESVDSSTLRSLEAQIAISIIQVYPELLQRPIEKIGEDDDILTLITESLQTYWLEKLIDVGLDEGVFIREKGGINLTPEYKGKNAVG